MRPGKWVMPVVALLVLLGTYAVTRTTGVWSSSTRGSAAGHVVAANLAPADIKGWMTLKQVSDATKLPLATILQIAGVPDGETLDPQTALRDLEASVPGFSVVDFRAAVEERLARPG